MKVLISDPIAEEGIRILKDSGYDVSVQTDLSPEQLVETIEDYDAIVVRSATKVTRPVIEAGKKLKVIGRAGVGLDNVDREAAGEKGIKVLNTPAATSASVAELALAMMFACARPVVEGTISLRAGKWEKKKFKGTELAGKILGIIGIGRIGSELARRATAIGMKVIAFDPYIPAMEGVEMVDKDYLLKNSDYISLHLPLTPETKYILSTGDFDRVKQSAAIINCARGGVVDEEALYRALKDGKVRKAAVDVYEIEPSIGNRLFELDSVIATPHIGAQTAEGQTRAGTGIARKVAEALKEA
jgi:D-3-phosphoglycerate dehydrogenase